MRRSSLARARKRTLPLIPSHRPPDCPSLRSADLAGRSVRISPDIPAMFDRPLAAHHKLVGSWVASKDGATARLTRPEARRHIEQVFQAEVLEILRTCTIADLRVVVLNGESCGAPAIAIVCDSVGQLDLGWIEDSDRPIAWRAAAYRALECTLGSALPVFCYDDLFDNISMYYWDGETEDDAAREALIGFHGNDPGEIDAQIMPSAMNAKRPEWMFAAKAAPLSKLPTRLRRTLRELRDAHAALTDLPDENHAWRLEMDLLYEYVPGIEECSPLPPLTLVPVEQFAVEVDDVGRHGMEYGFMDVTGLCPMTQAAAIDAWLASLAVGARLLRAAKHLIELYPPN